VSTRLIHRKVLGIAPVRYIAGIQELTVVLLTYDGATLFIFVDLVLDRK
jgi:hypothetical protein